MSRVLISAILLIGLSSAQAQKVIRTTVHFDFGKDGLLPATIDSLDAFFEIVEHIETAEIFVRGHTDSIGSLNSNGNLGLRRAHRVCDYLHEKGLDADRMKCYASGETKPTANNGTDNGRAQNRRVSIAARYEFFYTKSNSFHPNYAIGATVILKTNFEFNSTEVKKASFPELDAMIDTLLKYPDLQLEIGGHVAINDTKNRWLSNGRAEAIRAYFVKSGISYHRIDTYGWGGERRLCTENLTEKCLSQNRRVEVTIVGK
jgi:outer membrane protein OmpA-like peptidoglycan-associated protein